MAAEKVLNQSWDQPTDLVEKDSSGNADASDDRRLLAEAAKTCEQAAAGNLEPRVLYTQGSGDVARLCRAVNHMLDMTDPFLREVGASLEYASRGKFFRRVLLRGMRGSFRHTSEIMNQATEIMAQDAALKKSVEHRRVLADHFEGTVKKVFSGLASSAARVNTAALRLSEAAGSSAAQASAGPTRNFLKTEPRNSPIAITAKKEKAHQLNAVIGTLTEASQRIGGVVNVISEIALQTNMLALNATIEAARAGQAGKGFAVVANEVKALSLQTSSATEEIGNEIGKMRATVAQTAELVGAMSETIAEMREIASLLTQQTEALSGSVDSFLVTIRS